MHLPSTTSGRDSRNPDCLLRGSLASRRRFLRNAALASASALLPPLGSAALDPPPDYTLEIGEVEWELSP
ncbi:MAG TPA: hypothetical protein VL967_01100, partial [Terracidiphilus sp.]|nr:hypothetical protein [Terracidiphilus sp.]